MIVNRPSAKSLKPDEEFRAKVLKPAFLVHRLTVLHACHCCCYFFVLLIVNKNSLKYRFLGLNVGTVYDFPPSSTVIIWVPYLRVFLDENADRAM